ncbi:TIGR03086 family metal-binding protein [Streptomyces profundus]|uniref:TIGR03086 family metal-binding protein n=1 Tax=Streptomyces profundus TaxID=2867410 RepID=UPI001D1678E7|nr:TIGR03086 family metal-binding protein [Streptomyces sp. MA3_2.13]UED85492.1 TIGR03086 family protein [Streptomyces sp. MA3_2.13]
MTDADATDRTAVQPLDLRPVADRLAALLDGVPDDRLDAPTPCPGMPVRRLLEHLLALTTAFRDSARKDLGPLTDTDPDDPNAATPPLPDDWRRQLRDQLAELAEAWREPAAWRGATRAGGVDLPGEIAGVVALNEVLLHGWDLARATDQPYVADPASLRASIDLLSQDADDPDARAQGPFGPPVPVPADAAELAKAVALSGRSPSWTPPPGP